LCSLPRPLLTREFVARVTENLSNSHGTADTVANKGGAVKPLLINYLQPDDRGKSQSDSLPFPAESLTELRGWNR